jgi:DNA-binding Lrp family transcriptional regulator
MTNMDEIDMTIIMYLLGNSRTPYQEIADKLNMSVNSIHKRVKNLVNLEIIKKFITNIHRPYNNVVMYGSSKTKNVDAAFQKLGNNENIYNVTQASNNFFILHANIATLKDLDPLVSFVRQTGEIDEPTIGLDSMRNPIKGKDFFSWESGPHNKIEDQEKFSNSKLIYAIINSIRENSRKTISEIANEVGTSTKTVRRRLNELNEKNYLHYTIDFVPDKSGDIISYIILKLNPNTNVGKEQLIAKLRKQFGQKILFPWIFSNLPNEMLLCIWTQSMQQLQEIEKFASQMSNIIDSAKVIIGYQGENFYSLRDRFLDEKLKEFSE